MFDVRFYLSPTGDNPVRDYIDALSGREQDKALAFLKKLENEGHMLRRPTAAHIGGKLWELRPNDHRILYAFDGATIVLLHAFCKKAFRIPGRELDVARKRLKDWLEAD